MLIHVTQDSREIALCELEDNHLKNQINLLLNNAAVCKAVIQSGERKENISEVIHGVSRKQQIGQAKVKLKEIYNKLPHYIMEASIRGIHFSERLREVFDRQDKKLEIEVPIGFQIESLISS